MILEQVSEKFEIYFAEAGLSKTYGRLFGFFMSATQPTSMGTLVEKLQISKSTASTELRRLLAMGVIEKVLLPSERADFYQLKKNIWSANLNQKIQDIRKLRDIIKEIPHSMLENLKNFKEMAQYCDFLETELEALIKKYMKFSKET